MKAAILNILKQRQGFVSGETLSSQLNVSRVAVWKQINNLKSLGYDFSSGPAGYRLDRTPDIPYPWELGKRQGFIHYQKTVSSTMEIARDLARNGCPSFTVAVAQEQTRGRGRLQRAWDSKPGGLYFTVVTRPNLPPATAHMAVFTAATALARILRNTYSVRAMVKWPNDILVNGEKLVGILAEMEAEGDLVAHVNVGIGINISNQPDKKLAQAVSLSQICHKPVSRIDLLNRFLDEFEKDLEAGEFSDIISEWKSMSATLNQKVKVVTINETAQGFAVDVDTLGALLIRTDDGHMKRIIHGDCFIN